jgi:hypothetical protein
MTPKPFYILLVSVWLVSLAGIFGINRWAEQRIASDNKAMLDSVRAVRVAAPLCSDEQDRLFKLMNLAAAWVDTLSLQRAEIDSLRRVIATR